MSNIPKNYIADPRLAEKAFITYSVGGKNIFSILNGVFPSKEETLTFPLTWHRAELHVENKQGVKIPLKVFTKSKRVTSYYFHT